MKTGYASMLLLTSFLLSACTIMDRSAAVTVINPPTSRVRDFILLGDRTYYGQLASALAKTGFNLKPISIQANVTEAESSSRIIQYKEAGGRYALNLTVEHDFRYQCVFSRHHGVQATMSVLDIRSNDTLLVVEQWGPDGNCPPLTPVWDLLATELRKAWLNFE